MSVKVKAWFPSFLPSPPTPNETIPPCFPLSGAETFELDGSKMVQGCWAYLGCAWCGVVLVWWVLTERRRVDKGCVKTGRGRMDGAEVFVILTSGSPSDSVWVFFFQKDVVFDVCHCKVSLSLFSLPLFFFLSLSLLQPVSLCLFLSLSLLSLRSLHFFVLRQTRFPQQYQPLSGIGRHLSEHSGATS